MTAHEVLDLIGGEFLDNYATDTGKAWSQLMLELMRYLSLLTSSGVVDNLKNLIAVCREIELHIRQVSAVGGGRDGEQRLPMDAIGQQWRIEPQSGELAVTAKLTKKPSRQKAASSNKSTTSSALLNNNAATNSETNGSVA